MLVLSVNKTKMLRLVRAMGYDPPRNANFVKAFRSRSWWLEWEDEGNSYQAFLSTSAGRAFLGMKWQEYGRGSPEKWTAKTLTMEQLRGFDLVEEVPERGNRGRRKAQRVPQS